MFCKEDWDLSAAKKKSPSWSQSAKINTSSATTRCMYETEKGINRWHNLFAHPPCYTQMTNLLNSEGLSTSQRRTLFKIGILGSRAILVVAVFSLFAADYIPLLLLPCTAANTDQQYLPIYPQSLLWPVKTCRLRAFGFLNIARIANALQCHS